LVGHLSGDGAVLMRLAWVLQSATATCEVCGGKGVVLQRAVTTSTVWAEVACPHCSPLPFVPPMPILQVGAHHA
jgi:hypothetical protein